MTDKETGKGNKKTYMNKAVARLDRAADGVFCPCGN
jgi:hypothetical protein